MGFATLTLIDMGEYMSSTFPCSTMSLRDLKPRWQPGFNKVYPQHKGVKS